MEDTDAIKEDYKITNSNCLNDFNFATSTMTNGINLIYNSGSVSPGTNSTHITLNQDYFKKGFIKNLLDKIIEIKSLINKNEYEFFYIKNLIFGSNKSKIICEKKIDLTYVDELKKQSQLLLECIDNYNVNYKQKAIKHNDSFSNSWSLASGINNITWTTNSGTIRIDNDLIANSNINWIYTTNTSNITFTS